MPVRSVFNGKHSAGREFQSLAVRGKNIDINTRITFKNGDRKIMQPVGIMNGPVKSVRNLNQFSQFR